VAPHVPREVKLLAPSVLSAYTAGYAVAACLGVTRRQISAINDALRGAERYFRLAISEARGAAAAAPSVAVDYEYGAGARGTRRGTTGADDIGADAGEASAGGEAASAAAPAAPAGATSSELRGRSAAQAFRLVAGCWLLERFQVSRLGFVLASLDVTYLYVIWLFKYDLTTPAVAMLMHCAAECWLSVAEQEAVDAALRRRLRARSAAADERLMGRRDSS